MDVSIDGVSTFMSCAAIVVQKDKFAVASDASDVRRISEESPHVLLLSNESHWRAFLTAALSVDDFLGFCDGSSVGSPLHVEWSRAEMCSLFARTVLQRLRISKERSLPTDRNESLFLSDCLKGEAPPPSLFPEPVEGSSYVRTLIVVVRSDSLSTSAPIEIDSIQMNEMRSGRRESQRPMSTADDEAVSPSGPSGGFASWTVAHGDLESDEEAENISLTTLAVVRRQRATKKKKLIIMAILTGIFMLAELIVGLYSGSMALLADAFHMISDVMSFVLALIALRIGEKSADRLMTYGYERSEVISALANGVFLLALCFSIFLEAIVRLFEVPIVREPLLVFIVAALGFLINIVALFVVGHEHHDHSHSHEGQHDHHHHGHHSHEESGSDSVRKGPSDVEMRTAESSESATSSSNTNTKSRPKQKDLNIHGVFLHIVGDTLGSIGAMVNALVLWLSTWEDRFILDPLISIVIVIILVIQTAPLVAQSARVLMMESPEGIDLPTLQQQIEAIGGVSGVHDLHVWQLSQRKFVGTVHILVDMAPRDYPAISRRIQSIFHDFGIHMSTCQPEFPVSAEGRRGSDAMRVKCRLVCPKDCAEYMAGYMVGGPPKKS